MTLPREFIYDALIDDQAFAALPGALAKVHDARSAMLHWAPAVGRDIIVHNHYFAPDHLDLLTDQFPHDDLWSDAVLQPINANRAWVCDDLVSPETFGASRLYNEWNRVIGDDTFHALGAGLRAGSSGSGCIGLHRGQSMGAFSDEQRRGLEADIADITHMLRVRAKLMTRQAETANAIEVLDHLAEACITLDSSGLVRHFNAAARAIIDRGDAMTIRAGKLVLLGRDGVRRLAEALASASDRTGGRGGAFSVPRADGESYAVSYTPLRDDRPNPHILLTLRDPDHVDGSAAGRLAAIYALTPSECVIAVAIAAGAAPERIAEQRRVSIGTVRLQIKSIAWKLGCHRQSEIASTVNRLTALR